MAYVYTHTRLDKNEVFYVGIGSDKNYKRSRNKNGRTKLWKHIANKSKINIEIIADNISWEEACEIERYLIMFFGRRDLCMGRLVNLTDGGEGLLGHKRTPESIEKTRLFHLGRKRSLETIERNRLAQTGKKLSIEHLEKLKKRRHTPEAKEKIRLAGIGRKHSQESILKMKQIQSSPEVIEKSRMQRIGKKMSEANKEKMRLGWAKRNALLRKS